MALQIWLPLDGTLENKGCSNAVIENHGAVINTAGKIGSCYDFTTTGSYIIGSPAFLNNNSIEWSYACWFKPTNAHNGCLFSNRTRTDTTGITVFYYTNQFIIDDGARWQFTPLQPVTVGAWNHIAVTRNASVKKLYINGVLAGSTAVTKQPTIANTTAFVIGNSQQTSTSVSGNQLNGQLNDVRVYDHCLSVAEVHEIYQGLILHYKLDPYQNWITDIGERSLTRTSSNQRLSYSFDSRFTSSSDTHFTVDFDAKGTADDMVVNVYLRTASGGFTPSDSKTVTTEWEHYTIDFTGNPTTAAEFSVRLMGGTSGDIFYIKNVRLVSPNMPYLDTKVFDSSGYGHTGTIVDNVLYSADSPKYDSSINYSTNASGIEVPSMPMTLFNNGHTFSFWVKPNGENGQRSIYCGSYAGTTLNIEKRTDNKLRVYWAGSPDIYSSMTVNDGEWQHVVFTKAEDKGSISFYKNGEFIESITGNFSNKNWSGTFRIGRDSRGTGEAYVGLMSDFRIYCTALPAEDIKDLYQTSAKVDKSGKFHTFEFAENEDIKITKNGIVESKQFSEYTVLEKLKYDPITYFEPDGSAWVRIFHHNNPTAKSFSSSNDFQNSVYIDEDRWFNLEVCNNLTSWEIMVKTKRTPDDTEKKYRWIQSVNPLLATYNDVDPSEIVQITDGYTSSSFGGFWKKNSNTYIAANSGSSSNWWGAVGAWNIWHDGIPGYAPNTNASHVITTGYEDVFIRIDNQDAGTLLGTKIKKAKSILANEFIER